MSLNIDKKNRNSCAFRHFLPTTKFLLIVKNSKNFKLKTLLQTKFRQSVNYQLHRWSWSGSYGEMRNWTQLCVQKSITFWHFSPIRIPTMGSKSNTFQSSGWPQLKRCCLGEPFLQDFKLVIVENYVSESLDTYPNIVSGAFALPRSEKKNFSTKNSVSGLLKELLRRKKWASYHLLSGNSVEKDFSKCSK